MDVRGQLSGVSSLSSYHMGSGTQTQVIRFCSKCLCWLSHPMDPFSDLSFSRQFIMPPLQLLETFEQKHLRPPVYRLSDACFTHRSLKCQFQGKKHEKPVPLRQTPLAIWCSEVTFAFCQLHRKTEVSRRAIGSSYKIGSLKIIK